ncbi:MAG: hypothetical protein MUC49_15795 [Raineya sp.]|jgi:hypothetical protein|nr:hypothetical protein [Raineya sp.]
MRKVKVRLKDSSASFEDSGQKLIGRSVMSFPKTEKVERGIKTGLLLVEKEEPQEEIKLLKEEKEEKEEKNKKK